MNTTEKIKYLPEAENKKVLAFVSALENQQTNADFEITESLWLKFCSQVFADELNNETDDYSLLDGKPFNA